MLRTTLTSSFTAKLAASALKPKLKEMKTKMDYSEYGGAGLFGLKAPVIKAHGSSDGRAVYHAIRQAREMVSQNVAAFIEEKFNKKQMNSLEVLTHGQDCFSIPGPRFAAYRHGTRIV